LSRASAGFKDAAGSNTCKGTQTTKKEKDSSHFPEKLKTTENKAFSRFLKRSQPLLFRNRKLETTKVLISLHTTAAKELCKKTLNSD